MNRKPSMEVSLTKMWKPLKYRYEKIAMVLGEKTVLVRLQNYILEATKVHLKRDDKNNLAYGSSFFSVWEEILCSTVNFLFVVFRPPPAKVVV